MDASKHGRNSGTAVFMQKGSTLKVMEEFNIQGKQNSFYKYCPRTFGYTLIYSLLTQKQNNLLQTLIESFETKNHGLKTIISH
jgi:hypothetical protein